MTSLAALFLIHAGVSTGQPAPGIAESKSPYDYQVVLQLEPHRSFTPIFREQIRREIKDSLKSALGPMARIQVSEQNPLGDALRSGGLDKGLSGPVPLSSKNYWFVMMEVIGSKYRIQTRLFNGYIGLPSPAVRVDTTEDRSFLSRKLVFLLEQDLGLIGKVASDPDRNGVVSLEIRGGGLSPDLSRWVQKGDVFRLLRSRETGPSEVVESAYLQVVEAPQGSVCSCKVLSRYLINPLKGLRAELLGTQTSSMQLRLMQEKGGTLVPLDSPVNLQFRRNGFEPEEPSLLQVTVSSSRHIDTMRYNDRGIFSNLAFLTVLTGDTVRAKIPVPILPGIQMLVIPSSSEQADLAIFRFRSLLRKVIDANLVQSDQFREINELTAKPEARSQALARVRTTLERLKQDHEALTRERDEVLKGIQNVPPKDQPPAQDLALMNRRLESIKAAEAELLNHVATLEKIEKEENDPKRKEWLIQVERAKRLEGEAELGQAIAIYEKAPDEFKTMALQEHLEKLKLLWNPRDDKHAKARKLLMESWPGLDTAA
ncbi:MAG: hypothetical protein ACKO23_00950, partial [Gemmataceae bacterium]